MMFPRFPVLNRLFLGCLIVLSLVGQPSANGWPWNSEPQPLLDHREPVRADAGSPLAWDQSARVLWFLRSAKLSCAYWTGNAFSRREFTQVSPIADAGFAVDPGWHFLYYTAMEEGVAGPTPKLHCLRRSGDEWIAEKMGDEPISKVLGVDRLSHAVFAYDSRNRGIRLYAYDVKLKGWNSYGLNTGLGEAGDAAAIDSLHHIIYSSHETADFGVTRHPKARSIGDPTQIGAYKPWPLVETRWNGSSSWDSRVIDETGVPQQPAVRTIDQTVFYARRDDGKLLRTFKNAGNYEKDVFASLEGWFGTDTFEDHDRYKIRDPQYPKQWLGLIGEIVSQFGFEETVWGNVLRRIALQGPITVVPVYAPVWRDTVMPPRLTRFRALLSPREGRLVTHTERCEGEVVREQTGKTLVGYLYRDANGVLAKRGYSTQSWGGPVEGDHLYPELRANDPPDYSALADPGVSFYVYQEDILSPGGDWMRTSFMPDGIPAFFSTDPNAPFVPAHLRLPTSVSVRTFGHDFLSAALDQPGARFQHYRNYGTDYAMPSAIAVDRPTGATFYTQAAPPAKNQDTLLYQERYSDPPLAGFRPEPDPKLQNPEPDVWIAMVYERDRAFVRKSGDPITPLSAPVTPRSTPTASKSKSGLEIFGGNGMTQSTR
jgi:hypothetical protein